MREFPKRPSKSLTLWKTVLDFRAQHTYMAHVLTSSMSTLPSIWKDIGFSCVLPLKCQYANMLLTIKKVSEYQNVGKCFWCFNCRINYLLFEETLHFNCQFGTEWKHEILNLVSQLKQKGNNMDYKKGISRR
jgi:hypothetical protein